MFYVCDEHKVAFAREPQAKAHWNFQHEKGDTWITADRGVVMQDTVPEGYVYRATPARTESTAPPPAVEAVTPAVPRLVIRDDPEAERLDHMLRALGAPDVEVNRIVNGFVNIPAVRADPNYLSHWLDTHMRADRALKSYIPMVVQEVLGQGASPMPLPGVQFDGGGLHRFPSQFPGFPPNNQYATWPQQSSYFPTQDPEVTRRFASLDERFESVLTMMREEKQDRERERQEREQREREEKVNARIDELQKTVIEALRTRDLSSKSDTEQKAETQIEALFTEIKELRTDQQTQVLKAVLDEVANLRQAVAVSKGDTVGRSTEDLVHDLGPIVADKFDKMGERVQNELKGLREQVGPTLKENLERAAREPRTVEQIEEQVNTENRIISLTEQPQDVEVIVEDQGAMDVTSGGDTAEDTAENTATDQPYARMPSRRNRRQQRGEERGEEQRGEEVVEVP